MDANSPCYSNWSATQIDVLLKLNGVGYTWPRISKRYANSTWGIQVVQPWMLLEKQRGNSHRLIHVNSYWFSM
ncbi:hypothetical protein NJF45_06845 [Stenotrophomonas maltophilia]|uniref:hypothetical protein n=1 Tax=Stenotrophomonas maltophilia TaxID=40324 RepID=UPI002097EB77|nr:hypothetical protein [Stenotrophomonas maltophilia]MCO7461623.1 hypothetical protein [Stenotrophomonas maltophilia]